MARFSVTVFDSFTQLGSLIVRVLPLRIGLASFTVTFFSTWVLLVATGVAAQAPKLYQVLMVIDGDTFDATDGTIRFRVRIAGMDAPEKGTPFSKLATVRLKNRIGGKKIQIRPIGPKLDRYNRVLGQVTVDDSDIGIEMIESGLATYYRPGCVDYPANKKSYDYDPRPYIAAEERARAKKRYLWSDPKTILPCVVRRASGH